MADVIKIVGAEVGDDYTTIAAAIAGVGDSGEGYSSGDDAIIQIRAGTYNETGLTFVGEQTGGHGNDVTLNSVTYQAFPGDEHLGVEGAGVVIVGGQHSMQSGTVIEDIEFDLSTGVTSLGLSTSNDASGAGERTIRRCMFHTLTSSSSSQSEVAAVGLGSSYSTSNESYLLNCVIHHIRRTAANTRHLYGIVTATGSRDSDVHNCVVYDVEHENTGSNAGRVVGLRNPSGTNKFTKNNIAGAVSKVTANGDILDFQNLSGNQSQNDHNMSEDGTATDSANAVNSLANQTMTDVFVAPDSSPPDFRLKSGSNALNAGEDLGTSWPEVGVDITGRDRDGQGDVWSMGAFQLQATSGLSALLNNTTADADGQPVTASLQSALAALLDKAGIDADAQSVLASLSEPGDWLAGGFSKRKRITLDADNISSTLTDYTAYVNLGADADVVAGAMQDGRDIRVTAADGLTELPFEFRPENHCMSQVGSWTWFNHPRALYANGKTYVGQTDRGSSTWRVTCTEIDHATGDLNEWLISESTVNAGDDHNNPVFVRRSDGRLIAFYTAHVDSLMRYRISTNADDASAWGTEQTIDPNSASGSDYTYSQVVRLSSEGTIGRIYWFYRYRDDGGWYYVTSDDDGSTWSAPTNVYASESGLGYLVLSSNGVDRIDILFAHSHPNNNPASTEIGHGYYDGSWKFSDGSAFTLPLRTATSRGTSSEIYGVTGTDRTWVSDILDHDGSGNPSCLWLRYNNGSATDARLMRAKWNGSAWVNDEVCTLSRVITTGNEAYYTGLGVFDRRVGEDKVFVCRDGEAESHELQVWEDDSGWSKTEDITVGTNTIQMRPCFPWGNPPEADEAVYWMQGAYVGWNTGEYWTQIMAYPPVNKSLFEHLYVKIPTLDDTVDTDIYVYYGNPNATDAQDRVNAWDSDTLSVLTTFADYGDECDVLTGPTTVASGPAVDWEMQGHPFVRTHRGFTVLELSTQPNRGNLARYDRWILGSQVQLAGLPGFMFDAFIEWQESGSAEHTLVGAWLGSGSSVLVRLEPSDNQIENFIVQENEVVQSRDTAFTIADEEQAYVATGFGDRWESRKNKTHEVGSAGNGNNLDASATPDMSIGSNEVATTKDLYIGKIGMPRLSGALREEAFTDAWYDNLDSPGTFYSFGSEEDEPTVLNALLVAATMDADAQSVTATLQSALAALLLVAEISADAQSVTATLAGSLVAALEAATASADAQTLTAALQSSLAATLLAATADADAQDVTALLGQLLAQLNAASVDADALGVTASLAGVLAALLTSASVSADAQPLTASLQSSLEAVLDAALADVDAQDVVATVTSGLVAALEAATAIANAQDVTAAFAGTLNALLQTATISADGIEMTADMQSALVAALTGAEADASALDVTAVIGAALAVQLGAATVEVTGYNVEAGDLVKVTGVLRVGARVIAHFATGSLVDASQIVWTTK